MFKMLLILGSLTAVVATAILLLINQNSLQSPNSLTPTPSSTSSNQLSLKQNNNVLVPLLPSLTKPLISAVQSPLKETLPESQRYYPPITIPRKTLAKPSKFVPSYPVKPSLQKPPSIVTQTLINPVKPRQFISRGESELPLKKLPPVFTHRSRPIVPPIDYPVVPTESIATPIPIIETPTPNTPRQLLTTPIQIPATPTPNAPTVTPTPTPATPTPNAPTVTPTPLQLATPTPTDLLSTPTPTPTNSLATPTPTPAPN